MITDSQRLLRKRCEESVNLSREQIWKELESAYQKSMIAGSGFVTEPLNIGELKMEKNELDGMMAKIRSPMLRDALQAEYDAYHEERHEEAKGSLDRILNAYNPQRSSLIEFLEDKMKIERSIDAILLELARDIQDLKEQLDHLGDVVYEVDD